MNKDLNKLVTGSRVAIIGGGPAGSFFALYLLHYARERDIRPEITIYQRRDFNKLGTKGCKGCAGILSSNLLRNLGELNLSIPEEIIQNRIERYVLHSPYSSIGISKPEGEEIASIYRGGGPRMSHYENSVSFDGWLLSQAQRQGVEAKDQTVSGIYLGQETTLEVDHDKIGYDFVVLASGVNARSVTISGLDYIPPKTRTMVQHELYAGTAEVESHLGNTAHVFLIPHSGLIFGSLVPKGPFINVSVLSSGKHPVSITDFLSYDIVRNVLPEHYDRSCGCMPQAVVGCAQNYYADRFVAVGDAVVCRLYKDGINSSLLTAREAARTIVYHGLSRQNFKQYYQPFCRTIDRDNRWGRRLFQMYGKSKDSRTFLLAQHRLVGDEQDNTAGPQPYTKTVWGMLTGSYSYRSIARMILGPASMAKFLRAFSSERLRSIFHKGIAYHKELDVEKRKVLILGSGFGGAYTLRHMVRSLNRDENIEITMVSNENFFLFSPLLHEVAMGKIGTRHIAYPIRRLQFRDRFNFVQANVEKIDLGAHKVVTSRETLDFDYLVLALGSVTDMSELQPLESDVFTLKTLHDSMLIRNHIISVFERASIEKDAGRQKQLLTFVISGGGYTGIQLVTELREFIFVNLLKFYRTINPGNIRIILVEANRKIASGLHPKLGAYVMKHLQSSGIEVRFRSRVTHAWKDRVEINGTEIIPTSTLIWQTGVIANPRVAELGVEKDNIGRVLVNEYLEVTGVTGVYAVGDCAHFEDPISSRPIPPRAHIAVRQAKIAAHNIVAEIRGRDKKPYRYSNPIEIISLGSSKAVFRFYGLRLYGFPARLIWLGGYSLLVMGKYNRTRILMDWLLSLVFGRDITLKVMK